MQFNVLIINPGSTSTKIAVYQDDQKLFEETIRHSTEDLSEFERITDQLDFRKRVILAVLNSKKFDLKTLHAVVGRGGMLKPVEGGTYQVNERMLEDLRIGIQGQHASNLGGILASEISKDLGINAYTVDPVVVDEMAEVTKISGIPEIKRKSIFHALNQKAVAKRYAREIGKPYLELNLIVAHMGGGVSVGVHHHGRVVDVNNALDGDGPFSPERSGGVPIGDLVRLCYSGKYSYEELMKKIVGSGGIVAYLNTNDFQEVTLKADEGDDVSKLNFKAFIYQVGKEIGACASVVRGKVDAIILTGGIAFSQQVIDGLRERIGFIAPIVVYPGEDEMLALALGTLRVLRGEEVVQVYP